MLPREFWPLTLTRIARELEAAARALDACVRVDSYDESYVLSLVIPREMLAENGEQKARDER